MGKYQKIHRLKILAEQRGGKCLSNEYVNAKTKLFWLCAAGHTWEATSDKIQRGYWCPFCAGNIKSNIETMRQLATSRNGQCLSSEYINSKTKLLWECEYGHQWEAAPSKIKSGQWCPACGIKRMANFQRGTLEEMLEIAKERGGNCLSDTYTNANKNLTWQCSKGHIWEATPGNIKSGKWCAVCAGNRKYTITEVQRFAQKMNGKCLSKTYKNANQKLLWECNEKHQWESTFSNIKAGNWCPICAGKIPLTISDMQHLASEKGGKCLSTVYLGNNTKLIWQCNMKHTWEATPGSIKGGSWCPVCACNMPLNIEDMKKIANERVGRCLSDIYKNTGSKLIWQCSEGHIWQATGGSVKAGSWCPTCAHGKIGDALKLKSEDIETLAAERGGKCLSKGYKNTRQKLIWECGEGHQWETSIDTIRRGAWCPTCFSRIGESICREYFEQIFERKFPKSYPNWLRNKRGNQMELDGYCKSLGIAFEHHGEQHYSLKTHFIKTKDKLEKRKEDDRIKIELCKENGVILIVIPELIKRLPISKLKNYIISECKKNNIRLPNHIHKTNVELKNFYSTPAAKKSYHELLQLAREKGGICLSEGYLGSHTKHLWECKNGHRWEATVHHVKLGTWCPICSGNQRLEFSVLQKLAEKKGGKCLSTAYLNAQTKLLWECKQGHRWEATANKIKTGRWCPTCALKKRGDAQRGTLEDMIKIAGERRGKCLSDTYVNANSKLTWQCSEGHIWQATPGNIKSGKWCGICARKNRKILKKCV